MKTVTLNNGVKMPIFGLGTFRVEAGESAYDTVLSALQIGYRHIDTAAMYGNEESVGKAVKDSKIPRQDIFVTTKVWNHFGGDKTLIRKDIEARLKTLDLQYIDLLLIHWPNNHLDQNLIVWEVFEEFYDKGLIKSLGVSNFQIYHLEHLLKHASVKPVINQVECHPLLTQQPLHDYLKAHQIHMTSYGPLAKGKVFESPTADVLKEVADKYHATIAQVIVAWGIKREIIMIPKSVHPDRQLENFNGQSVNLTDEDIKKINSLNRGSRVYTDPDNNPLNPY